MSKSIDDIFNKISTSKTSNTLISVEEVPLYEHYSQNCDVPVPAPLEKRRSGKTTRCVDKAVQILFTKGELTLFYLKSKGDVIDPDYFEYPKAQQFFIIKVIERLKAEHFGNYTATKSFEFILFKIKKE